jgi:hypothetical protein
MTEISFDLDRLKTSLYNLRGDPSKDVHASVVVPINAAKDLANIFNLLSDLVAYKGQKQIEVILVVNNFPEENPPEEIETYKRLGVQVIAIPRVEYTGGVALAARIPGIRSAASQVMLLFDADCRIPDADALLGWYISQFEQGCDLAYTHVDYTDLQPGISIKARMFVHHASRWFRRTIVGMPTSRGSNYAIRKDLILDLFTSGRITYDIHVGPAIKSMHGKIAYSGARELTVYTSGRFFEQGWGVLFTYLIWRTGYYRRVFKLKSGNTVPDR